MKRERGFAMLLVFVMAAAVAITLYRELPRVAFESQRNKEELLIERGEQYSRAIQLYVRKVKRFPNSIEELENTNQVRFLRRRYKDPLTGKSEWRVVHVGVGGVFLDSVVNKPKEKKEEKQLNAFENPLLVQDPQQQDGQQPGFQQVRPSERMGMRPPGLTAPPGDMSNPQGQTIPLGPNAPGAPQPGFTNNQNPNLPPGAPPLPPGVTAPPGAFPPGFPFLPGQQTGSSPYGQPVSTPGGVPLPPGFSGPPGGVQNTQTPGQPGQNQPGQNQLPGQNQALGLINQILTQPRAPSQAVGGQPAGGAQILGGIGGFASLVERSGIKVYNEKDKYNEWEFLYDITKDRSGQMGAQGQNPINPQQQGQNPQQQENPMQQQNPMQPQNPQGRGPR